MISSREIIASEAAVDFLLAPTLSTPLSPKEYHYSITFTANNTNSRFWRLTKFWRRRHQKLVCSQEIGLLSK